MLLSSSLCNLCSQLFARSVAYICFLLLESWSHADDGSHVTIIIIVIIIIIIIITTTTIKIAVSSKKRLWLIDLSFWLLAIPCVHPSGILFYLNPHRL